MEIGTSFSHKGKYFPLEGLFMMFHVVPITQNPQHWRPINCFCAHHNILINWQLKKQRRFYFGKQCLFSVRVNKLCRDHWSSFPRKVKWPNWAGFERIKSCEMLKDEDCHGFTQNINLSVYCCLELKFTITPCVTYSRG